MRQLNYWPLRLAAFFYRVLGVLSILATVYFLARVDGVIDAARIPYDLRYVYSNILLLLIVLVGTVVTLVLFTLAAHTDVLLNINDNLNRIINAINSRKQRQTVQPQQHVGPPTVIPVSTHHD
jgi:hypothetical protein